MVPFAASTDAEQQVTVSVVTPLACMCHSILPFGGIFDKLTLVAESLQNGDSFRHAHIPGASG
jgi:hypothetical protein